MGKAGGGVHAMGMVSPTTRGQLKRVSSFPSPSHSPIGSGAGTEMAAAQTVGAVRTRVGEHDGNTLYHCSSGGNGISRSSGRSRSVVVSSTELSPTGTIGLLARESD